MTDKTTLEEKLIGTEQQLVLDMRAYISNYEEFEGQADPDIERTQRFIRRDMADRMAIIKRMEAKL